MYIKNISSEAQAGIESWIYSIWEITVPAWATVQVTDEMGSYYIETMDDIFVAYATPSWGWWTPESRDASLGTFPAVTPWSPSWYIISVWWTLPDPIWEIGIGDYLIYNWVDWSSIDVPEGSIPADIISAFNVGGVGIWDTIPAGSSLDDYVKQIHTSTFYPTFSSPTFSLSNNQPALQEIWAVVDIILTYNFNRWSINWKMVWGIRQPSTFQDYRAWIANNYRIDWTDLDLVNTKTLSSYTLLATQTFNGNCAYDAWPQPLDSEGMNYSSPLSAGDEDRSTTISAVYPYYGTSSNIVVLTKQTLAVMTSTYFSVSMVAEAWSDKQKADFETANITISGIKFYNTVSTNWERLWGSAVNSLTQFNQTAITHDIQGNTVNYTRFTHNGATIWPRQLQFYS